MHKKNERKQNKWNAHRKNRGKSVSEREREREGGRTGRKDRGLTPRMAQI